LFRPVEHADYCPHGVTNRGAVVGVRKDLLNPLLDMKRFQRLDARPMCLENDSKCSMYHSCVRGLCFFWDQCRNSRIREATSVSGPISFCPAISLWSSSSWIVRP